MKIAVPLQGGILFVRLNQFLVDPQDAGRIRKWISEEVDRSFQEARRKAQPAVLILGPAIDVMFIDKEGQVAKLGDTEQSR